MLVEVEGIIITERSYSETSKILTILTREYGVIGVLARGAKQLKSDLHKFTEKLTFAKFNIQYKKDKLSLLINATIIDNLKNIKRDIEKISYVSYILELTEQVSRTYFNESVFNMAIAAILKINENYDGLVIMNILELKYLDYLGVAPIIDCCCICGTKTNIKTLSASAGGFICNKCFKNDYIVSPKTLKMIRIYYYLDLEKIEKINVSDNIKNEINNFLDNYYERYTGLYLKSKNFIKTLKNL